MLTKKPRLLVSALLLAVSSSALSNEISYDFVQVSHQSITDSSIPGTDVDATGFDFSGSFSLTENIAFIAGYNTVSYDEVLGISIDGTSVQFGILGHQSISTKTDVNFGFSILNADLDATNGVASISEDDSGNVLEFGIRHMINDSSEVAFSLAQTDIFDDSSSTIGFGLRFHIANSLSLGVGYSTSDDVDAFILNLRAQTN